MAVKGKSTKRRQSRGKRRPSPSGVNLQLVKALAHELRIEILSILNERVASPNELSKELEEGLSQVSYHVKVLKDYDCITQVKTEPRRGAVEHYYRATSSAFLTGRDWQGLPASVRPGLSADLVEIILDDAASSLEEGSFDSREDRHLSRTPLLLDEQGWKEVQEHLGVALKGIARAQKKASTRMARTGEEGFNASVAMMGFELPEAPSRRSRAAKGKKAGSKPKAKAKGTTKPRRKGGKRK